MVKLFGYDINKAMSWKHNGQGEYVFDHIHPANARMFMSLLKTNTVVVPLRHPKCVAVSWRARQWEEQEMIDCWDFLVSDIDPLQPHYLPIDSPRREDFLAQLNEDLDMQLETLWEPEGVKHNNHRLRHEEVQASPAVNDLCERIKPFLDRFY